MPPLTHEPDPLPVECADGGHDYRWTSAWAGYCRDCGERVAREPDDILENDL